MARIDTPPQIKGDNEQIKQIVSYLFRLSETLNVVLNDISKQPEAISKAIIKTTSAADTANELRSLIANTATTVTTEVNALRAELSSSVVAMSDTIGTYTENINSTIEATARDVVTSLGYDSSITALEESSAGFAEYKAHTEGYIRQGFISYDSNNVPIIGIAIGQNLISTTVTINGIEYQQFDSAQSCAFYTADRVSFRINGQEVAYISNSKLYIGDVEITGNMTIGDWLIEHSPVGIAFKWVGD